MATRINNIDLIYKGSPAAFVIETLEQISNEQLGAEDDPHRHNYYSLIWTISGSGKHIIDFREYAIEASQIFFVSPEQVHQVILDETLTGIVIRFTCDFLQKYSIREDFISNLRLFRTSDETPPLAIHENMKARLKLFADNMIEAFHSTSEMRYESIGAYLKLFLIECNTHCSLHPETNPQSAEVGRSIVRNFKNLVDIHFSEWHQVQDYAGTLNVTPSYLNEVIKTAIGQSAKDYIQNRLILEARRMSLFTVQSIKEIGYTLGFDDPSHFSKFYKSYTGQSLLEFKSSSFKPSSSGNGEMVRRLSANVK
jgi:AraC family transcriptional regulator, transcriptional activator of pobA